jgi:O-antigen/teichoic acid export membrane protein
VETPVQPSLGRTILRNTLFVSSGGGLIRLLSFAYTIYYVRTLGEHVYGQYATVLALTGLFSIFFELGTTQYVERSLAQDRSRLPELLWMLIVVRLVLALAGIVLLTGLVLLLGYEPIIVVSVLILTCSFILAAILTPLMAIFTSHERYDLWTSCQLLGQLGTIALGALVLSLGGGLELLIASGLVAMLVQIGYCLAMIKHTALGTISFYLDTAQIPGFLKASLPFALTSLALTISFNVDTFLLSLLQPNNVVGWYSSAYRLVPTIVSILGGFLTVITPSLARTYVSDQQSVRRWTRISIKWLAMFGLPMAVGTSLLATQIISQLYGPAYAPAAIVLAVISWDIPLRLFNAFAGNVTSAVGLERTGWRIFMTGALVGVALYVPAIWQFGMLGAAVVTVATDGITSVLFFRMLSQQLEANQEWQTLIRVGIATATMGLVVWSVNQAGILPLSVAAGMLSYAGSVYALGLIDQSILKRAVGILSRVRRTQ